MKDLKDIFENRRSINYFDKNKEIDDEVLRSIIDLATLAPSAFNLQPWRIIAIKSQEFKERLYNEACNQEKVLEAPVTLAVIGDTLGYRKHNPMWDVKIKNGMSEAIVESIIDSSENNLYPISEKKAAFAARNASLFAMSLMYAAKYYGVDTHAMIGFNEDKVKEIFQLDDNMMVVVLIAMGYHDDSKAIKPRERRLKYEDIVKEV